MPEKIGCVQNVVHMQNPKNVDLAGKLFTLIIFLFHALSVSVSFTQNVQKFLSKNITVWPRGYVACAHLTFYPFWTKN